MAQLRIALAQVDTTVGDLAGNAETVLRWSRAAADDGADLVLFPELALTGYPPEDLVFRESFRSASVRARDELARRLAEAGLGELAVIVGYVDSAGGPRNACAVLYRARSRRPTSSTTCPTTASSTRRATSCPATGSWSPGSAASTWR
jgi:NAD+ synthase (glutamine-hydrolysing)